LWITSRVAGSAVGESGAPDMTSGLDRREPTSAYREGYVARVRAERREYAFMGSVVGTIVFVVAVLRLSTHLRDQAASSGAPPTGNPAIDRIPVGVCCVGTALPLSGRNR
jgi:hypothetical protein